MEVTREQVRKDLRVWMSRTGMDLHRIADETGFAHRSLIQFASGARYGAGDGADTAAALKSFMEAASLAAARSARPPLRDCGDAGDG